MLCLSLFAPFSRLLEAPFHLPMLVRTGSLWYTAPIMHEVTPKPEIVRNMVDHYS